MESWFESRSVVYYEVFWRLTELSSVPSTPQLRNAGQPDCERGEYLRKWRFSLLIWKRLMKPSQCSSACVCAWDMQEWVCMSLGLKQWGNDAFCLFSHEVIVLIGQDLFTRLGSNGLLLETKNYSNIFVNNYTQHKETFSVLILWIKKNEEWIFICLLCE